MRRPSRNPLAPSACGCRPGAEPEKLGYQGICRLPAVLRAMKISLARVFCRGWRVGNEGSRSAVLVVLPVAAHQSVSSHDRLAHGTRIEG